MSASSPTAQECILQPPWNGMTLPGLIAGAARLRADAPFISDGPGVELLAHRPRRELSYGALHAAVDAHATQLRSLGLQPGEVVLIHLPNTVESAIALLGVLAAGGIPAPLAIFEDSVALKAAAGLTGAAGMITIASFSGLRPAENCRTAAIDALNVRFVAAFGADVPEGIVPLDTFDGDGNSFPDIASPLGTDPALITFDAADGELRALLRSHGQLIADAAAAAALSRLGAGERVLATLAPSSTAGVILGLVLPLLAGTSVELVPLFDSCAFATQLRDGEDTHVILPGRSESAFRQFCEENAVHCESLMLVHRPDPAHPDIAVPESGHVRCLDVLCLGETAMIVGKRNEAGEATRFGHALHHPVHGVLSNDAAVLAFSVGEDGALVAKGPACPAVMSTPFRAPCPTGYAATDAGEGTLKLAARTARLWDAA